MVQEDSWVLYDGLLRERQTQAMSPEPGKTIVSTTTYDGRGLVRDVAAPQAKTGAPGDVILYGAWGNRTRNLYDELGRQTAEQWWRDATVQHETTFSYTEDTVITAPPEGGETRELSDGLGRTVEVAEHDGTDWVPTSYTYDLADRLTSVTDPEGNEITYSYNMAGWQTALDDPDRGQASFGYDAAGNRVRTIDGNGDEVHTSYDPIGRPLERRQGSPTGTLLASWDYDAPGEAGLLDATTRHDTTGDWVNDVTGYDGRGRALGATLTVPSGIAGLSGSYTTSQTYDAADRVTSVSYPAVSDLPAETVTKSFDSLSLPVGLEGSEPYVSDVAYDDRARPTAMAFGADLNGQPWMARQLTYDADQRLASTETWVATSASPGGIVGSHEFGYDDVGNVTDRATSLNGDSWRECYSYDARLRLVDAHTVDAADDCDSGTPGEGDQPYQHSFTYSSDGNLTQRVEDTTTTTNYSYPTPGADTPHAPTDIGGDSYDWDVNGNLAERTIDGVTETFTWDAEHNLTSVTDPDGTTGFVYDPAGQRLLRATDDGATLYVAGHEVHANSDGSTVTAVRSYTFNGSLVATRTADGVSYLGSDQAGSVEVEVESEGDVTASRAYNPYGSARSENGDMDTDRGFIGQIEDPTGLSYLNARYYDTHNGIFISPDPLSDLARPQTQNPYTYGLGNPSTNADPSGLAIPVSNSNRPTFFYHHKVNGGNGGFIGNPHADPGISRTQANNFEKIQTQQRNEWRQQVKRNAHLRRQQQQLSAMCRANCDPAFWKALKGAGSGEALILKSMHQTNSDPGFWRWLAKAGSKGKAVDIGTKVARWQHRGAVGNAIAGGFANKRAASAGCCPWDPIIDEGKCLMNGAISESLGGSSYDCATNPQSDPTDPNVITTAENGFSSAVTTVGQTTADILDVIGVYGNAAARGAAVGATVGCANGLMDDGNPPRLSGKRGIRCCVGWYRRSRQQACRGPLA